MMGAPGVTITEVDLRELCPQHPSHIGSYDVYWSPPPAGFFRGKIKTNFMLEKIFYDISRIRSYPQPLKLKKKETKKYLFTTISHLLDSCVDSRIIEDYNIINIDIGADQIFINININFKDGYENRSCFINHNSYDYGLK